jgi:hypothetical protein
VDGSKQQAMMTAGVDLGDTYSYLCLIDTQGDEVIEEGLLCAPGPRPPEDASPPSGLLCASQSRQEPMLRRLLVASSHYILGPFGSDSDLRRHGEKIASRGGKNAKKRAAVAVARKLVVLLHRLWVSGELYEPLYNIHRRQEKEWLAQAHSCWEAPALRRFAASLKMDLWPQRAPGRRRALEQWTRRGIHTQAQAREARGLWQGELRFTQSEGYGCLTRASKRRQGEAILFHLKIGRPVSSLTKCAFS